jgi:hypothetical protein
MTSENAAGQAADQTQLHESIVRQLYRRSGATGQIQLPAVPGLIDEYVTMCDTCLPVSAGSSRPRSSRI